MSKKIIDKRIKFPKWINEAYDLMEPEEIEDLVKALIYSQIQPHKRGFEISELLQKGSNRVPVLDTIEHSLWSLETAMAFIAWSKMDTIKKAEEKE